MAIPTNRGFTLIHANADGSHQINIYTKRPSVGDAPFAQYNGVNRVVIRTTSGFAQYGDGELSRQPVSVSWSEKDGAVYVEDEERATL